MTFNKMILLCLLATVISSGTSCNIQRCNDKMKANYENTKTIPVETRKSSFIKDSGKDTRTPMSKDIFYGNWVITGHITNNKCTAYSGKDIKKMIGEKTEYSIKLARFGEDTINKPCYKQTTVSKNEFNELNDISLDGLGIKSDSVQKIRIYDNACKYEWENPGSIFFIKDNNNLVLIADGAFFSLSRLK